MGVTELIKRAWAGPGADQAQEFNATTVSFGSLTGEFADPNHPFWQKMILGGVGETTEANHQTALTNAAYWRGLHKILDAVSRVPLHVLRNLPEGGSQKADDHASYRPLRYQANHLMPAGVWRHTTLFHAIHWGNGISYIKRDQDARVVAIYPLMPGSVWQAVMEGELWYCGYYDGEPFKERPENIFHVMGLSINGVWGLPFMDYARTVLGVGISSRKFTSRFFDNGFSASGLLNVPDGMFETPEEEEKFFEQIKEQSKGLGNAHKFMLVPDGVKFDRTSADPENAQMVDSSNLSDRDVANFLKLPPSAVGLPGAVSYNSLEQSRQDELDSAIDPWLCRFEWEAREKCLTERQKREESHKVEFKREALIRVDFQTRREQIRKDVNDGILTENEGREAINMPGLGPEGDRRRIPVNITYTDQVGRQPPAGQAEPSSELLENTVTPNHRQAIACVRAVQDAVWRAMRKTSSRIVAFARKPATLCAFCDGDFDAELIQGFVVQVDPAYRVAAAIYDSETDIVALATEWIVGVQQRLQPKLDEFTADEAPVKVKEFLAVEQFHAADFGFRIVEGLSHDRNLPV